jgi:sugar O-acyltransferase (sialic acid O-acetyltransferase NeuD family)
MMGMNNTAKELYIIGAGGFGREVSDTVREINKASAASSADARPTGAGGAAGDATTNGAYASAMSPAVTPLDGPLYRVAGFIDDDESRWGGTVNGIDVKGGVEYLRNLTDSGHKPCAVVTIADPRIKESIADKLDGFVEWINVIHPLALLTDTSTIGTGNIIQHFASINSGARLGNHCIVNCNSVIGHDVVLEDYVSVMPQNGIMGFCELKKRSYAGAGAVMIPNVVIGEDATVGAGAVVIRDVPPGATVVGNPARIIKQSK